MELKEAYNKIEEYYSRMCSVGTTSGRKYNYREIEYIMHLCPEVTNYWMLVDAHFYTDRVVKIKPLVKLTPLNYRDTYEIPIDSEPACAYILKLEEYNQLKVGKTKDWSRRMYRLGKDYGKITPLIYFDFDTEEEAYLMEVVLHQYYKMFYPECDFYPQDRFGYTPLTETDIEYLKIAAENIKKINWFKPLTNR